VVIPLLKSGSASAAADDDDDDEDENEGQPEKEEDDEEEQEEEDQEEEDQAGGKKARREKFRPFKVSLGAHKKKSSLRNALFRSLLLPLGLIYLNLLFHIYRIS